MNNFRDFKMGYNMAIDEVLELFDVYGGVLTKKIIQDKYFRQPDPVEELAKELYKTCFDESVVPWEEFPPNLQKDYLRQAKNILENYELKRKEQ